MSDSVRKKINISRDGAHEEGQARTGAKAKEALECVAGKISSPGIIIIIELLFD